MLSSAAQERVTQEAGVLATVWLSAYEEARRVVMAKGLPEVPVLHCAQMVADEVFNLYMQRLADSETSILS